MSKLLLEDATMRLSQLHGRIYVMDVLENLTRGLMAKSLETIWATPEWRQPWGFVIVMHDSATYDGDIRRHEMPPNHKRAVGTSVVTTKQMQRMVIKSIGLGLGLVSRFVLSAQSTLELGVAAQTELVSKAESLNRPY